MTATERGAVLCTDNACDALATHAVRQAATNCTWVLCHWCAIRYTRRLNPATTLTRLQGHTAALAAAGSGEGPYRITRHTTDGPRELGTVTSQQARLHLERAHHHGWAIRVHPDGSWAALDTTSGWGNPDAHTITAQPQQALMHT